ncbi:Glutathione hydrolase 1 proenzyme [Nymphon striatum]|nr:Glutathione hydrolase 1 proenzyme [Nymphon striatum]
MADSTPYIYASNPVNECHSRQDWYTVDAAIAAMLCIGVVVPHSAGIGGGTLMSIYKKDDLQKKYTLNARETAPKSAFKDMYVNKSKSASVEGGLSIGVPGQIKGMWESHQQFGRLPWSSLFEDSIELCREGAKVSPALARVLNKNRDSIVNNTGLRGLFWNTNTSDVYKEGDIIKNPKLGDTLERIALGGEDEFYEKETAKILVQDITAAGGIITKDDLNDYKADWVTPITTKINGMELFGLPAPSSTSFVFFVLNVMNGYELTTETLQNTDSAILTYHRLIEAFKYGEALVGELGDPKYANITEAQTKLLSKTYADQIRKSISDEKTFDTEHYDANYPIDIDHGTSHISILAPDGSAVAATTSINLEFGSKVVSQSTGIILNDQMDDFAIENTNNAFGKRPSPSNYIYPGKRPMSSMSPIIMVDPKIDNVTAVVGSSGGTRIPTTISQVMLLKEWLGKKTHQAVSEPRIHHQLFPNYVSYETDFSRDILDGLAMKGHVLNVTYSPVSSAANVIFHTDRCITTASDPRKGGLDAASLCRSYSQHSTCSPLFL